MNAPLPCNVLRIVVDVDTQSGKSQQFANHRRHEEFIPLAVAILLQPLLIGKQYAAEFVGSESSTKAKLTLSK